MIVGLESNSKIFTVSVHGLLELQVGRAQTHSPDVPACAKRFCITAPCSSLQAGQYTSIFVDNAAGASVTIQNGSDFMGMLLGV